MVKVGRKGIGDNIRGIFPCFKPNPFQCITQQNIFLCFVYGEASDIAGVFLQKLGKQGAFHIFSCNAAGHGEFCENKLLVFDFILSEAYDAVFSEIVGTGQGKDLMVDCAGLGF